MYTINQDGTVSNQNQVKLTIEEQIRRIKDVYGVSFSKKHRKFLETHGYDYVVKELIIKQWNKKDCDYIRNREVCKLEKIKTRNINIQLSSRDLYFSHELIDIYI